MTAHAMLRQQERLQPLPLAWNTEPRKEPAMRVALVDPSLFTLPYDRMLAAGLRQGGHDVVLHTRALQPAEDDTGGVTVASDFYRLTGGLRRESLPNSLRLALKGIDHVVSMAALLARLRRERPDVIHFQWLPLPLADRWFLPALARIAPLVLTVHDSTPFNGNPQSRLQRLGVAACFGAFDRLIVHTERFRDRLLAEGVPADRVTRIPHGLLGPEPSGAAIRSAAPASIGPPPPRPSTFVLFGQIKPYKGADVLIEAFARLPEALRAGASLRIVGKPFMDLAPLLDLARQRGVAERVAIEPRFVPEEEIPALFGPDSIPVFPYREIEASGALTLAIAHGRPVIASRLGCFAEDLEDGAHGLLVPPDEPAALTDAMERMLTDPAFAARCAANIRALASSVPSWEEIGRKTAAVYVAAHEARVAGVRPVAAESRAPA